MSKMNYRPTILNISAVTFLSGIIIYTIWNYKTLAEREGWGIVAMFGLAGIALVASLTDLILQKFIKNPTIINIIGLLMVIGLTIALLSGL
jgi:hypothetical protein